MEQSSSARAVDVVGRLLPIIADRRLQATTRIDFALRCVELMQGVPESFQLDFELAPDESAAVQASVAWMHLSFDVSDERLARMAESLRDQRWRHHSIEWWVRRLSAATWLDPENTKRLTGVLGNDAVELHRWMFANVDRSRALATLLGDTFETGHPSWLTSEVPVDVPEFVHQCRKIIGNTWSPIESEKPQMRLPRHDSTSLREVRQILQSIPLGEYESFPTRLGVLPGFSDEVNAVFRAKTRDAVIAGVGAAKYDDWVSTISAVSEDCVRFGQLQIGTWLECVKGIVAVTPPDDMPFLVSSIATPLAYFLRNRQVTWSEVHAALASCDRRSLADLIAVLITDPLLAENALLDDSTRRLATEVSHRLRRLALAAALVAAVPCLAPLALLPQFPMFSWNRDRVWSFLRKSLFVQSDVFIRQGWFRSGEWESLRTLARRIEACVAVNRQPIDESVDCWESVCSLGSVAVGTALHR